MAEGKNLVGVDIGSSSIKVCELREGRKGHTLHKVAYAPLPQQTIVDGHVMNTSIVIETLMRLFAEHKIKQRDIAVGVSGQSVIIRKITVPMMTAAELDEQIQWEAEQHIPFDIKDVQIDYQVLRRHPDRGLMDLLLVAAKRDEINDHAQFIREAKLRPVCVDIDAFCVQNLFEVAVGIPPHQTIALLNMGASLTSLNIVSGGTSAFTRDITSGGNTISEEIQRETGMSFEQAEAYKCGDTSAGDGGAGAEQGGMVPQHVQQVIDSACDTIAAEIQRSLDFFMATSGEAEINQIYVTGGTANLSSLRAAIQRRARTPVEFFNPVANLTIDHKHVRQDIVQTRSAQLAVAIGLALRKDKEKRS
ncbi:MAG TPA: type IV pilus assembly protein PilM [Polyangiaceae bacterium]|jgi:type IV pilus assembly protein PilM|nr:MAG: Competence protein A [Deltaproteobacteria bacterium ADurb.Bin207]HNS98546.1 type IV pilus assembly protein PilM [Polyangiaceae bacterium]HNZ24872.1 type IV pilus assembly protein PilM [Polyangiaceae bacterium]HOD24596.1 type IV pilus assembly protein PilM [Polyangiaceae bacterium]HOE50215.1 type IV pilus assembly protein PilM [Polyangiaceae bacterium]